MIVYPVIHVQSVLQAIKNAELAYASGADGVMFIAMSGNDALTIKVALMSLVDFGYPSENASSDFAIGVNLLQSDPINALTHVDDLADTLDFGQCPVNLWSDYRWSDVGLKAYQSYRYTLSDVFASFMFKGQDSKGLDFFEEFTRLRGIPNFIPTTSGVGTGVAMELDNLKRIAPYQLKSDVPYRLAIASGLTPDNLAEYLPYATHALVNTGISQDFHNLDKSKLEDFIDIAHSDDRFDLHRND